MTQGLEAEVSQVTEQPKTAHGRDKQPEADDPLELVQSCVPGADPGLMVTCLIEEYARLGMDEEQILGLFSQPVYQTHALYQQRGEAWIRDLIRKVLAQTGRMRVTVTFLHQIGGRDA